MPATTRSITRTIAIAATNTVSGEAPAGPPPVVLPIPSTGLIQWMQADAGTYSDTSRTTPSSANGADVAGWESQFGTLQLTSIRAGHPTIVTGQHSGKTCVRMDSHAYQFSSLQSLSTMEYFIVLKVNAASRILTLGTALDHYLYAQADLAIFEALNTAGARDNVTAAATISGTDPVLLRLSVTPTTVVCSVNNVTNETDAFGGFGNIENYTDPVMKFEFMGKYQGGTTGDPQIDYYESILYSQNLAAGDITQVMDYLNAKYTLY